MNRPTHRSKKLCDLSVVSWEANWVEGECQECGHPNDVWTDTAEPDTHDWGPEVCRRCGTETPSLAKINQIATRYFLNSIQDSVEKMTPFLEHLKKQR